MAAPGPKGLSRLQKRIDEKSYDLFKKRVGQAPLRVVRICKRSVQDESGEEHEETTVFTDEDVVDISQLAKLRQSLNDPIQIFFIDQQRSWTTLDISREVFENFMNTYEVFPSFWKCVLTFGRKSEENEFEFPGFSARRSRDRRSPGNVTSEMAYVLRRAELNGRSGAEGESPWSIRQTAVYHRLSDTTLGSKCLSRSVFLLVAASQNVKWQFGKSLDRPTSGQGSQLSGWNAHRILIADSLSGWADYMAYLGHKLKEQTDRAILATVGQATEPVASSLEFKIKFDDRQELKLVEDQVLDLQVIFPGLVDVVSGVKESCERFLSASSSRLPQDEKLEAEEIIYEMEEYCKEAKILTERAKILTARAVSSARMVSDFLNYEGSTALKNLALESQAENRVMSALAEKSTKDAAAVKTLTVITLIYLPTSIVANFFSTEFVQTDDQGHMAVTSNVWILAATSIPLTLITVFIWWGWVHLVKSNWNSPLRRTLGDAHQQQLKFRSNV
ncbi:hypothetical protein BKA65DRAFT_555156 [Rhexocercosporidium sp. MPI-PUGE-AT-0058]|nr:hypothetical protein BKA65DRAFT_555156 [Rhexocercosporidium sp. MPI-PUGE-AT-0058]